MSLIALHLLQNNLKVKTTQPNSLQYTTVSGKTKTTLSKLSDLDFLKKSPEDQIAQRFMLLPGLRKSNLSVKSQIISMYLYIKTFNRHLFPAINK